MDKTQLTLSQALEGYFIAASARRLSPHTLADYDNTYRKFERFLDDDPPLAGITAGTIRQFLNSQNGVTATTLLNYHAGLAALWTWALKEELVDRHVVRDVDRPKPEKRAITPYTEADLQAMLSACTHTRTYARPRKRACSNIRPTARRDSAIILLLVDTGIRASELCSLRMRDIDLKNRSILVMGKGAKERRLPFEPNTARAIWRYLSQRDDTDRDISHLFTTRHDTGLDRHVLRRLLHRIGERAGVPGANVHRFRHTFAIEFLRNYPDVFALKAILGHTSMTMVNRYLEIAQADIQRTHRHGSPVANWGLKAS